MERRRGSVPGEAPFCTRTWRTRRRYKALHLFPETAAAPRHNAALPQRVAEEWKPLRTSSSSTTRPTSAIRWRAISPRRACASRPPTAGRRCAGSLKTSAIDLVVLDIMMPGEDGLSLCRMLRETTDIPVILLTAHVGRNRPRRRPRDRRRRLRGQAVQPARAPRPHPRRASPLAGAAEIAPPRPSGKRSASTAGPSTPRGAS